MDGGYVQVQMDFLEACSAGDIRKTTALLSSGCIDSNFHHHVNGWTGLHWAARRGHADIVNLLLQTGFDPNLKAKDGKTPLDVAIDQSVKDLIQQYQKTSDLRFSSGDTMLTLDTNSPLSAGDSPKNHSDKTNGLPDTNHISPSSPNHKHSATPKHSPPHKKSRTSSTDFTNWTPSPESPTTPTRKQQEFYPYGRRDSLDRTKFLLVRTSAGNGKEAFRRVTLPGGGSVDFMKSTIERAMQMGHVLKVLMLPDRTPIETDVQIRNLANSQKVEVIFEEGSKGKNPKGIRKGSLPERTYKGGGESIGKSQTRTSYRIQKAFSVNENILMASAAEGDHLASDLVNEIENEDNPSLVILGEPSELDNAPIVRAEPSDDSSMPAVEVETSFTDYGTLATAPEMQATDLNIEFLPSPNETVESPATTANEEKVDEDKQPEKKTPQEVEIHEEEADKENKDEVKLEDSAATAIPSESPVHLEGHENQSQKISGDFSMASALSESTFNDDNNNDEDKVELEDSTSTPVPSETISESVTENVTPAQQEEHQEEISPPNNIENEVEVQHADEKDANEAAVLADVISESKDSGKDVSQEKTEVIRQPKGDSKASKLLNSIVGDENDPYRPLKIAVLVAGVVSVSGGIAYYYFVRVK